MSSTLSNITAGIEAAGGANRPTMEPTSWLQDLNIAVEVICPVFAFLFVLLRIFVRAQMGTFGWGQSIPYGSDRRTAWSRQCRMIVLY